LSDAHPFGRFLLGQAIALHGLLDFDHQPRFDLELFGIGKTQVSKHIA
jgi:hypothetical protein